MGRMRGDALLLVKVILLISPFLHYASSAQLCGLRASGAQCQSGYCCSTSGYCERTRAYCGEGNCDSQCSSSLTNVFKSSVSRILKPDVYANIVINFRQQMGPHHSDAVIRSSFNYSSFIQAANSFGSFGTIGNLTCRQRDIAAFFAHMYHETDGYNNTSESNPASDYCDSSYIEYPCAPGKSYYGRGPLKLTWNYNYGAAGKAIGQDLLNDPDLLIKDPVIGFKTALWFWTTAQEPRPSCDSVMNGYWSPSPIDILARRFPGFGLTINIFNGEIECGPDATGRGRAKALDRITQYANYTAILGADPGSNVDCSNTEPYSSPLATY